MKSWVYGDAYYEGQRVLAKYLKEYEGVRLEEAIKGTPVSNEAGECYLVESSLDFSPARIGRELARKALLSSLRLLRGIGPGTEAKLKRAGYHTIEDLLMHRRWREQARRFMCIIDSGDACRLQEELWHWLPRSHPLNLHATAINGCERLVALDIETMGLFSRPIILFGAAFARGERIVLRQYLARGIEEEAAAIEEFCSSVEGCPLISYNGRSFDVPYISQRISYYGLGRSLQNVHVDLLPLARRAFGHKLPDARLATVERHIFGLERKDDVPGALVPEFYEEYLQTKNPGPLIPIIEHNRNDLYTLARLYSRLCEGYDGSC